jgi:hypothetical protein
MASSMDEQILRTAKEIMVKFIETGRVSPAAFPESFKSVYLTVKNTVSGVEAPAPPAVSGGKPGGEPPG